MTDIRQAALVVGEKYIWHFKDMNGFKSELTGIRNTPQGEPILVQLEDRRWVPWHQVQWFVKVEEQ